MKVLIGSQNPGKMQGAKEAFSFYFEQVELEGIVVSSDVGEEPINEEIYKGARNRVDHLMQYAEEKGLYADYFLGIESGITNLLGKWMIISVAVIKDHKDRLFEEPQSRAGKGGISFLTNGLVSRIDQTRDAFVMALTQHISDVWNDKT